MNRWRGALFAAIALAATGLGSWWVLRDPMDGSPPGAGQETEAASPLAWESIHATPRDTNLDRPLTASPDAFRQYEEGAALQHADPVEAMKLLQGAARLDPAFAPAHYRMAVAALLADAPSAGVPAIRAARDAAERLPEPYRTAAEPAALFLEGSFDLLAQRLPEALRIHPGDPDLHLLAGMLAACSCDHFDPTRTARHMKVVLEANPESVPARRMMVEAAGLLGVSVPFPSRHPAGHVALRRVAAEQGRQSLWKRDIAGAMKAVDEVLRLGGDVPGEGLGPAFILSGDHDGLRALDDSEMEPLRSVGGNVIARLHAGINEMWSGRFGQAASLFERGAEYARAPWQRRDAARLLLLVGRARVLAGRTQEGIGAIEAALRLAPNQGMLHHALGMAELARGDAVAASGAARRLAHEMRRGEPGWTEPWRLLLEGEIALAGGDAPGAVERIRQARRLAGDHPVDCVAGPADAWFLDALGRAALAAGTPAVALEAFDGIIALGPGALNQPDLAVGAIYRSGLALELLGRSAEAAGRLREYLKLWGQSDGAQTDVADARRRLEALSAGASQPPPPPGDSRRSSRSISSDDRSRP